MLSSRNMKICRIRNLIFIVLFLFMPMLSFSQSEEKPKFAPGKEKHRNKTDELGRKQGTWMFFNTFGEKLSEMDFVNDQKEGMVKRYYSYDRIKEEQEFLGGMKEGQYTRYFFSGQVQMEGQYKEGKKDGKWTKYFEDGTVRQEGTYANGRKEGVWKTYNRKGVAVSQATYKGGTDLQEIEAAQKKKDEDKKASEKRKDRNPQPLLLQRKIHQQKRSKIRIEVRS
jgi:hypothetical protein